MTTGLGVLVAALLLATLLGLAKRRYDGRFRTVATPGPAGSSPAPASDTATSSYAAGRTDAESPARLTAHDLGGVELGERATLVQFSSAFCQPCRATRRVLADVAGTVPGVEHVEVDAESNLDLVRRLGVLRTPTTLVLDADGRITTRASGAPRKEQVLAALPS